MNALPSSTRQREAHSFLLQEQQCRNHFTPPVLERLEKLWLHDFGLDPLDSSVFDVVCLHVLLVDDGLDVVKGMAEIGLSRRDCW